MTIVPAIRWLLPCIAMLGIALPAHAQPEPTEPRKYIEFKIDPNFEKAFRDRLKGEQQLGPLKDLVKKIAADPSKFPMNEQQLKGLKLDDPNFKQALKDWVANDDKLRQQLQDWVKQNGADKQKGNAKQIEDLKKLLAETQKTDIQRNVDHLKVQVEPKKVESIKPKTDALTKTTERVMKQAGNSKLGDWLKDSPAWRRAFIDLRTSMDNPSASRLKLDDWQNKFRLPEGKMWKLGEGALERIQQLPRPNLQRWTPSIPGMGNLRMPAISAPAVPNIGGPSLPAVSTWLTWLLLIVLFLLTSWQILRWNKRSKVVADERVQLGPWPVRPEAVLTRSELVQAFDYLALLTLSHDVQSWNHHAIARSWRDKSPTCAESAVVLALLYEQARYTEGPDALTDSQRDQARRSLLQIAEGL
jgi:hypothetical protein